jgi:hypothetical protein
VSEEPAGEYLLISQSSSSCQFGSISYDGAYEGRSNAIVQNCWSTLAIRVSSQLLTGIQTCRPGHDRLRFTTVLLLRLAEGLVPILSINPAE